MSPLASFVRHALSPRCLPRLLALALMGGLSIVLFLPGWPPQAPDGSVGQQLAYSEEDEVVSATDAAGRTTRYTVTEPDEKGLRRRIRESPDGSKVTEEFDPFGRRVSMTDAAGKVVYGYDGFSRLASVRRNEQSELRFTRYPSGQVKSIDLGSGLTCRYHYDLLGRLSGIDTPAGAITVEYSNDAAGQSTITWRFPNGIRTARSYDADHRVQSITHTGPGDKELAKFTYAYRPDGLVREVRESWPEGEVVRTYLYDNVQRLATVIDSRRGTTSYHYDQVGNRVEVVSADRVVASEFDWAGRLVRHAGASCSYDDGGNLRRWSGVRGSVHCDFTMDSALAAVQRKEHQVNYQYDGDGRLVSRTSARRTEFVVDPETDIWRPLLAQDQDGKKTLFVWQGRRPVAAQGESGPEFYLTDRLGSVRLVADRQGEVRRLDYDPFGVPSEETDEYDLRPRFSGLFYDSEATLYLTTARAYAPELARFLQMDPIHRVPIGSQKDLSAYAYCGNDPVNFVDHNGAAPDKKKDWDISSGEPEPGVTVDWSDPMVLAAALASETVGTAYFGAEELTHLYDAWKSRKSDPKKSEEELTEARSKAIEFFGLKALGKVFKFATRPILKDASPKIEEELSKGYLLRGRPELGERIEGVIEFVEKGKSIKDTLTFKRPKAEESSSSELSPSDSSADMDACFPWLPDPPVLILPPPVSTPTDTPPSTPSTDSPPSTPMTDSGSGRGESATIVYDESADGGKRMAPASPSWGTRYALAKPPSTTTTPGYSGVAYGGMYTGGATTARGITSRRVTARGLTSRPPVTRSFVSRPGIARGVTYSGGGTRSGYVSSGSSMPSVSPRLPTTYTPPPARSSSGSGGGRESVSYYTGRGSPAPLTRITYDESARRSPSPGLSRSGSPSTTYSSSSSPMAPRPVGGVRLAGAAESLRSLGSLKGVAVDPAGRLVLIGDDRNFGLPQLRLDDVVTVFRCVYMHGEAPFVSIDPDPADPDWKIHKVRHDKGTKDTYVGWVLFEADRVMKCYDVGKDNLTGQRIRSRVPGYKDSIELAFELNEDIPAGGSQCRNWIVPAGAVRRRSEDGKLTLLEVPMMVRTERTVVRDGKIVDAPELGRSPSDLAFAKWFTDHYDDISREWQSEPPPGSGITGRVPVFAELKRIAMIAAVAENLRDQGVPFPIWMRDYPVRPCNTPPTTPGVHREETRSNGQTRLRRMAKGGVQLSPPTASVKTIQTATAAQMAPKAAGAVAGASTLSPVSFEHEGQRYQAVALPGGDSGELGGLHLAEADLALPLTQNDWLSLPRIFDSFFDPAGELGRGWTLDLPRLETFRHVTNRDVKTAYTSKGWRLLSCLGTEIDFRDIRMVSEVGVQLAVPDRPGPMFGITGFGTDERIGVPTEKLLWRDGKRWHFDKEGRLRALEQTPLLRVFHYDDKGHISKVEGWLGKEEKCRATLLLTYDGQGRIQEMRGRMKDKPREDDRVALYTYAGNRLHSVKVGKSTVQYQYNSDGLVSSMFIDGKEVRSFTYGPGGRLLGEQRGGATITYELTRESSGVRMAAKGDGAKMEEVRYDAAGRLIERSLADDTSMSCTYDDKGALQATLSAPGEFPLVLKRSADGRQQQVKLPTGGEVRAEYDDAGRTRSLAVGGEEVLHLDYKDGLVASAANDRVQVRPVYRDGMVTSLRITPVVRDTEPAAKEMRIDLDDKGRVRHIQGTDGQKVAVRYDDKGRLESLASTQGEAKLHYDDKGRLQSVLSPQGEMKVGYDGKGRVTRLEAPGDLRCENTFDPATGRLQRIQASYGRASESMEFDQGLLVRVQKLDKGQMRLDYETVGETGRRLRRLRMANGLELTYEYDEANRLAAVNCGSIYRLEYRYDEVGRMVGWKQKPLRSQRGPWQ